MSRATAATDTQRDLDARSHRLSDTFVCEMRRKEMHLAKCLDDYMNANALRVKSMVCHECAQGAQNRELFAADADTEGMLDAEIWARLLAGHGENEAA